MTILEEAQKIIDGERKDAYGPPNESFFRIAQGWSVLLDASVSPQQVALMMIWLKTCREVNSHSKDNLVDIAGYAALAQDLET